MDSEQVAAIRQIVAEMQGRQGSLQTQIEAGSVCAPFGIQLSEATHMRSAKTDSSTSRDVLQICFRVIARLVSMMSHELHNMFWSSQLAEASKT